MTGCRTDRLTYHCDKKNETMRHVAAPTHVGPDRWPVLSAVRIATADDPAEFVVLADCDAGDADTR